jgi:hypothetical protein
MSKYSYLKKSIILRWFHKGKLTLGTNVPTKSYGQKMKYSEKSFSGKTFFRCILSLFLHIWNQHQFHIFLYPYRLFWRKTHFCIRRYENKEKTTFFYFDLRILLRIQIQLFDIINNPKIDSLYGAVFPTHCILWKILGPWHDESSERIKQLMYVIEKTVNFTSTVYGTVYSVGKIV